MNAFDWNLDRWRANMPAEYSRWRETGFPDPPPEILEVFRQDRDNMLGRPKRGWPKGKPRTKTGRLPNAHIDLLAEVVLYGRHTLKMSDAAMAAELGYSRERIRQARARRMGNHGSRCKAGHRLPPGRFVYCEKCDPPPKIGKRILCLYPGCKNMSDGGVCRMHMNNRRYAEDPAFRERHKAANAKSKARAGCKSIYGAAQKACRARKAAGWTTVDPLWDR